MQSEVVAAEIATRCGLVQRVAHTIVYWMRELVEVEGMYCWSVVEGQPVFGIGRIRASGSIADVFVDAGPGDGMGLAHVVFDGAWS